MSLMETIRLTDKDISISNGQMAIIADQEALAQNVWAAIALFNSEWFLSPKSGVDWFTLLSQKNINENLLASELRKTVSFISEVIGINYINIDYNNSTRIATITISMDTIYGEITLTI